MAVLYVCGWMCVGMKGCAVGYVLCVWVVMLCACGWIYVCRFGRVCGCVKGGG